MKKSILIFCIIFLSSCTSQSDEDDLNVNTLSAVASDEIKNKVDDVQEIVWINEEIQSMEKDVQEEYVSANFELNNTYSQLKKLLDSQDTIILRNMQRLWIDYRDNTCDNEVPPNKITHGQIAFIDNFLCRIELTNFQTQELKRLQQIDKFSSLGKNSNSYPNALCNIYKGDDVNLCFMRIKTGNTKTDSVAPPQSEKRLTPNGYHNISIGDSISDIENKLGTRLDLGSVSEICDTSMLEGNTLQFVFADDKLLFLTAFEHTTEKGFKVGDTVASLKNKYPNVVYHFDEYPSVGEEGRMNQSKYFTTKPNKEGNIYIFKISSKEENIIESIVIENIASRDKNVCEI